MDTSKIIDVLCQIVGGGVVGIITYWISSKLWPASVKKDAMEHTLEYALTPIQKILKPIRLLSIEAGLSGLISSSALKVTEVIT
ncbi:hypothetical protein ACRQU7_05425 [Caproiciproducens sp. R1]|uniref:hypothetical protein n=1 Tax=Caproiciproducens sp. R1 TaxID=3435000 RepID=UPI0040346101